MYDINRKGIQGQYFSGAIYNLNVFNAATNIGVDYLCDVNILQ